MEKYNSKTISEIPRIIVVVLDSVGIGALPDASIYGDEGANTLVHIAEHMNGLHLPNLEAFGLGNITPIKGVSPVESSLASYGKMKSSTHGKDTMAGHWEMMGILLKKSSPVFPGGFPADILEEFYSKSGISNILGNKTASGTVIIQELGEEHLKTGHPIVYTSADSVFQIAAHEDIIPIERLYEICRISRKICDKHQIGRVIARPFNGKPGNFKRTPRRKDFPMVPSAITALDILAKHQIPVTGIGKIEDIFAGRGINRSIHTKGNLEGMQFLTQELSITKEGFIFVNLVDFDMLYGHRNDVQGYSNALESFDSHLGEFLEHLKDDDYLIITADHGCDPTYPGTDHSREYVPLLAYNKKKPGINLGTRSTFADIGASILKLFNIEHSLPGHTFLM